MSTPQRPHSRQPASSRSRVAASPRSRVGTGKKYLLVQIGGDGHGDWYENRRQVKQTEFRSIAEIRAWAFGPEGLFAYFEEDPEIYEAILQESNKVPDEDYPAWILKEFNQDPYKKSSEFFLIGNLTDQLMFDPSTY